MEALRRTREFWLLRAPPRDLRIIFLSNLFWASGLGLYAYIWPIYIRDLGATVSEVGLVLAFSTLVASVAVLPGGVLADRFDRKWVMILGWSLGLPAPIIYFYAGHWTHLLPGVLLYFSTFLGVPALTAYIADSSKAEDRMSSFGFVYAGFPVGLTYSPALGAYLLSLMETRYLFLFSFVFYLASALVVLLARSVRHPPEATRVAPRFRDLLGSPSILAVASLMAAALFITYLAYVYIPLLLRDLYKASLSDIQILGVFISLGSAAMSPSLGRLGDLWSRKGALIISLVLFSASILLYLSRQGHAFLILGSLLAGTFYAIRSIGDSMMTILAPTEVQGTIMSIFLLLQGLAMTGASYLGGMAYDSGLELPFMLALALAPVVALLAFLLPLPLTSREAPSDRG